MYELPSISSPVDRSLEELLFLVCLIGVTHF
jgi:hypothetical protein